MDKVIQFLNIYGYLVGIVGGLAGIAALLWQINDKLFFKPKIKVITEFVYEDDKPSKIEVKAINNGNKSVQIVRSGLTYSNKKAASTISYTGLLTHWVRGAGGQHSEIFKIQEIVAVLRELNEMIEYGFVQGDDYKIYQGKVPDHIKTTLQKMISNTDNH